MQIIEGMNKRDAAMAERMCRNRNVMGAIFQGLLRKIEVNHSISK
jgi:hypothetical protein